MSLNRITYSYNPKRGVKSIPIPSPRDIARAGYSYNPVRGQFVPVPIEKAPAGEPKQVEPWEPKPAQPGDPWQPITDFFQDIGNSFNAAMQFGTAPQPLPRYDWRDLVGSFFIGTGIATAAAVGAAMPWISKKINEWTKKQKNRK
jgi:hypothetical protein